jgi:hypothetical protein
MKRWHRCSGRLPVPELNDPCRRAMSFPLPGVESGGTGGCSQQRLFQPPIARFSGTFDTVSRKNDTMVWGNARFRLPLAGIRRFPARNMRAAALLLEGIGRGRYRWLSRKRGSGNGPGCPLSGIVNLPSERYRIVRYLSFQGALGGCSHQRSFQPPIT